MRPRIFIAPLLMALSAAAQSKPETAAAFDRYVASAESRIRAEQASPQQFLRIDSWRPLARNHALARLRRGEIVVENVGNSPEHAPGGLIHDWAGTAFIPGVTVAQVLAVVQDYGHLARYYQPDVQDSRLIARDGNDFRIFMRLRQHKVITVVLDTDYDVRYGSRDPDHWYSTSRSTRIAETDGEDHGFLWRLNSYWRFVQVEGGVIIQCEAISLTRDIPTGMGWLVRPFVTSIPRESLEFTMTATRNALRQQLSQSISPPGSH